MEKNNNKLNRSCITPPNICFIIKHVDSDPLSCDNYSRESEFTLVRLITEFLVLLVYEVFGN